MRLCSKVVFGIGKPVVKPAESLHTSNVDAILPKAIQVVKKTLGDLESFDGSMVFLWCLKKYYFSTTSFSSSVLCFVNAFFQTSILPLYYYY